MKTMLGQILTPNYARFKAARNLHVYKKLKEAKETKEKKNALV